MTGDNNNIPIVSQYSIMDFPELTFDAPGVYNYTIREHDTDDRQWIIDERVFRVVITVITTSNGTLEASVEYPDGKPIFINRKKQDCNCKCCCCFWICMCCIPRCCCRCVCK